MDENRLQTGVPLSSHSFESWRERLTEDRIRCSLEEHGHLEGFQVVDEVGGPVIDLELRQLEVPREWLLHYARDKRWLVIIPLIGLHRGVIVVECIFYFFFICLLRAWNRLLISRSRIVQASE